MKVRTIDLLYKNRCLHIEMVMNYEDLYRILFKKILKQKKKQKLKKNENQKKRPKKSQNGKWAQKFFQAYNTHQKTKKMRIAKLNSAQCLQRNWW